MREQCREVRNHSLRGGIYTLARTSPVIHVRQEKPYKAPSSFVTESRDIVNPSIFSEDHKD